MLLVQLISKVRGLIRQHLKPFTTHQNSFEQAMMLNKLIPPYHYHNNHKSVLRNKSQ